MDPEYCPFHRTQDTCLSIARILVDNGLLAPAPDAPVLRTASLELPALPSVEDLLAVIARQVDLWGRAVVDPTLPAVAMTGPHDERQLRYLLQALYETVSASPLQLSAVAETLEWWKVRDALREAQSAAHRSTVVKEATEHRLWWYLAARHLEQAQEIWHTRIGHPLAPSQG